MSKPDSVPTTREGASREVSKEEVLAAARPLPPIEEMLIDGLTAEEGQRFLDTILTA